MSWEWSHAPEAYESGRKNLAKKSIGQLSIILAEWNSTELSKPETMEGPELDLERYEEELDKVREEDYQLHKSDVSLTQRRAAMADEIWAQAEQLRTCTNGGHEAWVCPYGCHLVAW